jgi:hypothetical protein
MRFLPLMLNPEEKGILEKDHKVPVCTFDLHKYATASTANFPKNILNRTLLFPTNITILTIFPREIRPNILPTIF